MPSMRILLLKCLVLAITPGALLLAQDNKHLDPDLPSLAERSNPVTYDVDFSVVATPPAKTRVLRVWLPIPPSDSTQEYSDSQLSTFPMKVEPVIGSEPVYGNRFAYFEFHNPLGAQVIRHKFRIKVWELRWHVEPEKILRTENWPASFDRYRNGDSQAVMVDDRFRRLLAEIVPGADRSASDFGNVVDWALANLEYDHHDASLRADATHALERRRGHCSDYHSLCASLGRAMGVPTRVTYGINTFPKNSPSHCKLEAFLPGYGWVSFDVSETQKLVAAIGKAPDLDEAARARLIGLARARLASGFRDNTWFLQTRGTDYELEPKASKRVPVVRTAYIEADGVPLPEPDPADPAATGFSWMTVHEYRADREVPYPFADWRTLESPPVR